MNLDALLHSTFGFSGFRANQEAVCRAATDGRDVLLVMPTGAGKSLCYQLPAIARSGPALVISPLIALMEDQSSKLSRLGLKVARIHSGMPREDSRQACRDYLDGSLQFLFIAPERMRVPGFPQMLAKRTPSLVAIDEAHCISAWGHDFRPDYRNLGEHLPALRPAPIVALTATATPTVQRDIANQLRLADPALFIHGFRRSNLAIEVVEMSKPQRHGFAAKLLRDPERRPAIVYAPSRKAAEDLAGELGRLFPAAAYHAGLDPGTRERVQNAFLSGKLDVVVATIAFGMGIDKADVRTVIHTALPASVEAYYQEIGRAGRDGLPSRTVLLHSFADRKVHEFFLERDYPPAADLARVARTLSADDFMMPEPLARELKMDPHQFQKAIEKLAAQGAATIDVAGNVRRVDAGTTARGAASWQSGYEAQIAFRRAQLAAMAAYAETAQCRMSALVKHFGDTADGMRPCGHCDVCAPESTRAQTFRPPTESEARTLRAILGALQHVPSRAAGKLHSDLGQRMERREFDTLIDSLGRAGLVSISSEVFQTSDGKTLPYKKVALTHEGRDEDSADLTGVLLAGAAVESAAKRSPGENSGRSRSSKSSSNRSAPAEKLLELSPVQKQLEEELRAWRKAEAAKTGKPAFIVFSDSVLRNIASAQPTTIPELLTVSGVGPAKADAYGSALIHVCRYSNAKNATPMALGASRPTSSLRKLVSSYNPGGPNQTKSGGSKKSRPSRSRKLLKLQRAAERKRNPEKYRNLDLIEDIRAFVREYAVSANLPIEKVLPEESIKEIACLKPQTEGELARLHLLPGDLPFTFYKGLLETVRATYQPEPAPVSIPKRPCRPERQSVDSRKRVALRDSFAYSPAEQALDIRLRDWRKAESDRLGLPHFFVLATSTLRGIVTRKPKTVGELGAIPGMDPEKLRQFGPAIVELCTD